MDVFDAIRSRRSIRHFSELPVEWEKVVKIIEAGSLAPSSGNIQNWRFVIVTDESVRARVAEACLEQFWMEEAPVFIVVVSEQSSIKRIYGERGEQLYAIQNCAASIENMLLITHTLGLGTCWVGAFEEEAIKRILSIPKHVNVEAVLPIGYPAEKPAEPMHHSLETLTFFEKYGNKIKDIDAVLWNFNILGRTVNMTKTAGKTMKKGISRFVKGLNQKKKTK